jgi:hypothetical protein
MTHLENVIRSLIDVGRQHAQRFEVGWGWDKDSYNELFAFSRADSDLERLLLVIHTAEWILNPMSKRLNPVQEIVEQKIAACKAHPKDRPDFLGWCCLCPTLEDIERIKSRGENGPNGQNSDLHAPAAAQR